MTALPTWPYPRLIAHRGGGHIAPENTLAAMRAGAARGYAMMEFDAKLSRDGVAVLLHDDTLERTTDGTGPAAALDFAALAQLDAGSWHSPAYAGEPIPTLAAVARYTLANGLASNVEIKPCPGREQETGHAVALAVARLWQQAQVPPLVSSFSETALAAAAAAAPALPRALLIAGRLPPDWRDRLRHHDCVALNMNQAEVTRDLVEEVHGAGARLTAWTVNDPGRARQLLDWGVDAIFTDALDAIPADF